MPFGLKFELGWKNGFPLKEGPTHKVNNSESKFIVNSVANKFKSNLAHEMSPKIINSATKN